MALDGIGGVRIGSEFPPVTGPRPAGQPGGPSFADALGQALSQVEALQQAGDAQAAAAANGAGNLHEVALALEKADVSMRVAAKVRNKLLEAYQEVMRMPV
jgi:flagellar hook-basal body complex protein FliE